LRKILFSAMALIVLLLAAEVGVTLLSQHGMEKALRSQYELPESLEVSINSFPFLLSLARNHLGELQLSWDGELGYSPEEGRTEYMPYVGRVNLYDVKISMPLLLRGRLEIRDISRVKAEISIDDDAINEVFGSPGDGFLIDDDKIYRIKGGEKIQYKVKTSKGTTLVIEPLNGYISDSGFTENTEEELQEVKLNGFPLEAKLHNASVRDGKVVLEISIPMWEGYLGSLKYLFKYKPLI
jgi:hypothetical protein